MVRMRSICWILNVLGLHPLKVSALSQCGVWSVLLFCGGSFEIALLRDVVSYLMLSPFVRYVQGWDNESWCNVVTHGQTIIERLLWLAVVDLSWDPRGLATLLCLGKLLINRRLRGGFVSHLCRSSSSIGSVILLFKLYRVLGRCPSLTWGTSLLMSSPEGLVVFAIYGSSLLKHLLLLIEVFKFLKGQC